MKKVEKTWGYEIWFENFEKYCCKELFVEFGKWSSTGNFHYHKLKTESFIIQEGTLRLSYELDNNIKEELLGVGSVFRIPVGMKHRFTAENSEGCKFIEVSTQHFDSDSYRCYYDQDKQEWTEV